ncbi:tripartite tricarboxylate transporter substrate binding protein [Orrella sp. NBD-18]|uniref:Tripartite tricarboxylate transporter substrate binding protein n=1 Tax=Sheuella amnicola TaxID=2707330 RepID=A0A6B2R1D2_9BURK|nr:tripartite tricarboxylate transporter substrate binding protein [Sheuella amnicola]NDY83888.1 tripartite tricarboxylate transporter substrate binding protein [Sheuella amnicola]
MKIFIKRIIALLAGVLLISVAWASESYPVKTVSLVIPYPPGGLSDILARIVNQPLSKQLGRTVIVENVAGASGSIGAQKVLNAPANGQYVFQGSPNELILAPMAIASIRFKPEDFRLVQMLGTAHLAIYGRPDLPAKTVDELIDYAKAQAAAGKPLTYASVGTGSMYHLLGEQFSQTIGAPLVHVPYKGGAQANQDLMGSQVDIFITVYAKYYEDLANSGKIRLIALLNEKREEGVKHLPTVGESTKIKRFTYNLSTGYFVKKDTPDFILQSLHDALQVALTESAVREGLKANNLQAAKPLSLEESAELYAQDISRYQSIIKSINLQPQ